MSKTQSLETILSGQLADSDSHWGLGSFGAIAELTRDHDEHVTLDLAALSAVTGRVEVYQPIPPPDGRSPQGPHTHVLPKLLSAGRTHAATEPIPEDLVPCLSIYPAHPAKDALGRTKPFQADRHDAFQVLLRWFGDPAMIRLKTAVAAALAGGEAPRRVENGDRFARVWIRIALRQAQASGMKSPALDLWRERYERPGSQDHNEDHSDISGCH